MSNTYINEEIRERNARALRYSVRCCRRRARQMRRINERNARIQRGLAIAAVIMTAVCCGVVLGGGI